MVNIKEWQRQQQKDIEKGDIKDYSSVDLIQINMEDEEIMSFILDNHLRDAFESAGNDLENLKLEIKTSIYMEYLKNTTKSITNWLVKKNNDIKYIRSDML